MPCIYHINKKYSIETLLEKKVEGFIHNNLNVDHYG